MKNKFKNQTIALALACLVAAPTTHSMRQGADQRSPRLELHYAAGEGNIDQMHALLQDGTCVNARGPHYRTPLHWAAIRGQAQAARILLEAGAAVNAEDRHEIAPLHEAAAGGHHDVVDVLLQHGANVDEPTAPNHPRHRTTDGRTPLQLAAAQGHLETVRLLLDRGANPNIQDDYGWTALLAAAATVETPYPYVVKDHLRAPVVQLLMEKGADPTLAGDWGRTYDCTGPSAPPPFDNEPITSNVPYITWRGGYSWGCTPLLCAIMESKDSEILEALLQGGANPNTVGQNCFSKSTPLLHCAALSNTPALRALLQAGAKVNAVDSRNRTALHEAARFRWANPQVELLLEWGADVDARDAEGNRPGEGANDNPDALEYIRMARLRKEQQAVSTMRQFLALCRYRNLFPAAVTERILSFMGGEGCGEWIMLEDEQGTL